jgi:hypothetical protein
MHRARDGVCGGVPIEMSDELHAAAALLLGMSHRQLDNGLGEPESHFSG